MPRIPMILQEDTTTISVEELDQAKPIPEEERKALVAKMLGREPSSPAEQSPSPKTSDSSPPNSPKSSRLHDSLIEELMGKGMSREEAEAWYRRL